VVLYSDLFEQPLRLDELHRYLPVAAAPDALEEAIKGGHGGDAPLELVEGLYCLAGRGALVGVRRRRELVARARWPRARRYGRLIGALPFVRLVAVSGGLAVANSEAADDVDLLIVTRPGRLWLVRGLVLVLVLLARRRGLELCPNYFLTTSSLEQPERGLYTARELAQLVPLYGGEVYRRLLDANGWFRAELPNAEPRPSHSSLDALGRLSQLKRLAEALLGGRLGDRLERAERERKVRKLRARADWESGAGGRESGTAAAELGTSLTGSDRVAFDERQCKGHFDGHAARIMRRYTERLASYGLTMPPDSRLPTPEHQ
jgi:hypothetical protein